jgi:hypothetical protein
VLPVPLVAVIVDLVSEVVAIVAILGNVSVVDVHVGRTIVAAPCPASSGGVGSRCGVCP